MFLVNLLRSGCFGNLDIAESVVNYFFMVFQYQFLLHICIVILVMFRLLQGNFFIFCGISPVVYRVINSGGVFLLRVSGSAMFFPAVQTICRFGNFIKIS